MLMRKNVRSRMVILFTVYSIIIISIISLLQHRATTFATQRMSSSVNDMCLIPLISIINRKSVRMFSYSSANHRMC